MGRFAHEASTWRSGILYQTEDRSLSQGRACLYRYVPDQRVGQSDNFAETTGPLEAMAVKARAIFPGWLGTWAVS